MKHIPAYALVVVVTAGASYGVAKEVVADNATAGYYNAVDACERGNPLRHVVFGNASISIEQSRGIDDPQKVTQVFIDNRKALLSVPGVDPETGEVDCLAVIDQPTDAEDYVPPEKR